MSIAEEKQKVVQDDLTVFVLVKTMPEWLGLSVEERFAQFNRHVVPTLKRYESEVRLRLFDTEFYSARVTDIWMWEAKSRHAYEMVVEELRETPIWDRFFAIVEILAGVENAYAKNHERQALPA